MNNVTLIGRLTKDPAVTYTQGAQQMAVARFTLAVDRPKRQAEGEGQDADFISCVAFGKTAEWFEKYLSKGRKIAVRGRIQTGSYTNKDGQRVYTTDVVVENAEFCDSKPEGTASAPQQEAKQPAQQSAQAPAPTPAQEAPNPFDDFMQIPEGEGDFGDLPFN